jgi:hypothetical protein
VPPDDGLRPHDEQVLAPITPEVTDERPEEPIKRPAPCPLARGASQDGELLTRQEVLDGQFGTTADAGADERHEEQQGAEHRPGMMPPTRSRCRTAVRAPTAFTEQRTYGII